MRAPDRAAVARGTTGGTTDWDVLAAVALGGAVGAAARYGLGEAWPAEPPGFPWVTFTVNVSGCLLLGLVMVLAVEVWPSSRYVRPLLGIGLLGGYTTFSTYALESRDLIAAGHGDVAGLYLAGSVAAALLAVWAGVLLARLLMSAATRRRLRRVTDEEQQR